MDSLIFWRSDSRFFHQLESITGEIWSCEFVYKPLLAFLGIECQYETEFFADLLEHGRTISLPH